jgi:outer membrane protease
MNHKHIEVIIEDHDYSGKYDTQDVINDLIDYVECVNAGDADKHYGKCIATDTTRS